MLKSKIASRRWIILDSFHITELNQTPLQSKRTVMALQFSQPEDVKTPQLRKRASAFFSPRQKRLAEPDPCYSSSSLCLGLGSQICLINFVSCNMGQVAGLPTRLLLCILKVHTHKNKTYEYKIFVLGSKLRLLPCNMCRTAKNAIRE